MVNIPIITATINYFSQSAKTARSIKKAVGADLFGEMRDTERKEECYRIKDVIKNPLFFKWLGFFMENFIKKLKKDWFTIDKIKDKEILSDRNFWEKDFIPAFFECLKVYIYEVEEPRWDTTKIDDFLTKYSNLCENLEDLPLTCGELLSMAFEEKYNWDNPTKLLKSVFRLWKADEKYEGKSLFRDNEWYVSVEKIELPFTANFRDNTFQQVIKYHIVEYYE